MTRLLFCLPILLLATNLRPLAAADQEAAGLKTETVSKGTAARPGEPGNVPARCEWFKDQALGMFIFDIMHITHAQPVPDAVRAVRKARKTEQRLLETGKTK